MTIEELIRRVDALQELARVAALERIPAPERIAVRDGLAELAMDLRTLGVQA